MHLFNTYALRYVIFMQNYIYQSLKIKHWNAENVCQQFGNVFKNVRLKPHYDWKKIVFIIEVAEWNQGSNGGNIDPYPFYPLHYELFCYSMNTVLHFVWLMGHKHIKSIFKGSEIPHILHDQYYCSLWSSYKGITGLFQHKNVLPVYGFTW